MRAREPRATVDSASRLSSGPPGLIATAGAWTWGRRAGSGPGRAGPMRAGCVKTRLLVPAANCSVVAWRRAATMLQTGTSNRSGVADCRYGTSFSHGFRGSGPRRSSPAGPLWQGIRRRTTMTKRARACPGLSRLPRRSAHPFAAELAAAGAARSNRVPERGVVAPRSRLAAAAGGGQGATPAPGSLRDGKSDPRLRPLSRRSRARAGRRAPPADGTPLGPAPGGPHGETAPVCRPRPSTHVRGRGRPGAQARPAGAVTGSARAPRAGSWPGRSGLLRRPPARRSRSPRRGSPSRRAA